MPHRHNLLALLTILLVPSSLGCIGSPVRAPVALSVSKEDQDRCRSTRTTHNVLTSFAAGTGVAAGAGGLATLPIDNDDAKLGVGIASLATGVVGAILASLASSMANDYAKDRCEDVLIVVPKDATNAPTEMGAQAATAITENP